MGLLEHGCPAGGSFCKCVQGGLLWVFSARADLPTPQAADSGAPVPCAAAWGPLHSPSALSVSAEICPHSTGRGGGWTCPERGLPGLLGASQVLLAILQNDVESRAGPPTTLPTQDHPPHRSSPQGVCGAERLDAVQRTPPPRLGAGGGNSSSGDTDFPVAFASSRSKYVTIFRLCLDSATNCGSLPLLGCGPGWGSLEEGSQIKRVELPPCCARAVPGHPLEGGVSSPGGSWENCLLPEPPLSPTLPIVPPQRLQDLAC